MPSCIFYIVVDRMIVSRNRLEGGGVCICKCAAWDRKTSPTRRSSNLRGGTTVKLTGSKSRGCFGGDAGGRSETSGGGRHCQHVTT